MNRSHDVYDAEIAALNDEIERLRAEVKRLTRELHGDMSHEDWLGQMANKNGELRVVRGQLDAARAELAAAHVINHESIQAGIRCQTALAAAHAELAEHEYESGVSVDGIDICRHGADRRRACGRRQNHWIHSAAAPPELQLQPEVGAELEPR